MKVVSLDVFTFCLFGLCCFVIRRRHARPMMRDTGLLNQRCVRNLYCWFFETRPVVRPVADSPSQRGVVGRVPPPPILLNTKICCGLFRAVFRSCVTYSGILLRDGVISLIIKRAPDCRVVAEWLGAGDGGTGYLPYLTRQNSVECSARKSSRHSMRDLRKFTWWVFREKVSVLFERSWLNSLEVVLRESVLTLFSGRYLHFPERIPLTFSPHQLQFRSYHELIFAYP
jgi:hypothetical protein